MGLFNPFKTEFKNEGITDYAGIPPIIFSYEKNVSKLISLGGMLIYTSASGYYTYYDWLDNSFIYSEKITPSILFLGAMLNFHIYTTEKLDFTAGLVIGYAEISNGSFLNNSYVSGRYNVAFTYYLTSNFGLMARTGTWGKTFAFDLGASIKF